MPSASARSLAPLKGSPETRVQWFSDTPGLTYLTTVFTEVLSKSVITSYMSLFKLMLIKQKQFISSDHKPYFKCLVATCGDCHTGQHRERIFSSSQKVLWVRAAPQNMLLINLKVIKNFLGSTIIQLSISQLTKANLIEMASNNHQQRFQISLKVPMVLKLIPNTGCPQRLVTASYSRHQTTANPTYGALTGHMIF